MKLGLHVGLPTIGAEAVSESGACHWIPFPYLDLLVEPQWKRMCPVLLGLDFPGWGGTQGGSPSLRRMESVSVCVGGAGFVRIGLGGEVEGGCY